jgi:hypothetical protein
MGNVTVVRWRKYGKDRLYANISDIRVGWVDLKTGDQVIEQPAHTDAVTAAFAAYAAENRITLPRAKEEHSRPQTGAPAAVPAPEPATGAVVAVQAPTTAPDPTIHIERWTKHGKDRLYAKHLDGSSVGWLDLKTGTAHIDHPHEHDPFWATIRHYATTRGLRLPTIKSLHTADLAANKPGQAAHEQALNEYAKWQRGAEGEITTAQILDTLNGWHTIHAIPLDTNGTDLDHLTIGPGGIYTINSKNHRGRHITVTRDTLKVDRNTTRYIEKATLEAQRAGYLLSTALGTLITIRPLIVIYADSLTIKSQPTPVTVLTGDQLATWLTRQPAVMDPITLDAAYEAARRPSTWKAR